MFDVEGVGWTMLLLDLVGEMVGLKDTLVGLKDTCQVLYGLSVGHHD